MKAFTYLAVALACGSTAAQAASLEPVLLTLAAARRYALFWVHDGETVDAKAPKIGVVPTQIEIATDPVTKRPKLGIQYSFAQPSRPVLIANISAHFHFDREEVKSLLEAAQRSSDVYRSASQAQFVTIPSAATRIHLYTFQPNTGSQVTAVPLGTQVAAVTPDSTMSVAFDLSALPGKNAAAVFNNGATQIGLFLMQRVDWPVVAVSPAVEQQPSAAIQALKSETFIESDKLAAVIQNTGSRPGFLDWLFGRPSNTLDIRNVLGDARVEVIQGQPRFGWLIARDDIQQRLRAYEASEKGRTLRKLQDSVEVGAFLPLNDLCRRFPEAFLDLDSGRSGCGGLK